MAKKIEEKYQELSEINDNIIKQYYNDYINTHIKTSRIILDMPQNLKIYLVNRFSFTKSYLETLYCIINNIYQQPTCKICNKPVKFYNIAVGYSTYCSTKCSMSDDVTVNKIKNTFLKKYGVDWYSKSSYYIDKIHTTCLQKYNKPHFTQTNKYKEEAIKRNNEKYGCDYGFQSEIIKEKIRQTTLLKYGCENISQNKDIAIKKSIKMSSPESQQKHILTMKQNKSFNKSISEDQCYNLLKEVFPDIIRQYRDVRYPFNCDFYIPSNDLFIEYQGSHYHHYHEFDKNNINDKIELEKLKKHDNGHNQYTNIIKVWTQTDPIKRHTAKENKLNYIEFWNIDEVKNWLNKINENHEEKND